MGVIAQAGRPNYPVCSFMPVAAPTRPLSGQSATPLRKRLIPSLVFAPTLGVLILASLLTPTAAGHGTHTQLGLPPCGMMTLMGAPCPTCGMTTAFAHATDGDLLASWRTQPAGALLALIAAMAVLVSGYALATGAPLEPVLAPLARPRTIWIGGAVLLLAWVYKILSVYGAWV